MPIIIPPPAMIVVSTKGQVVIPREFRVAAGLEAGSKVILQCNDDGTLSLRTMQTSISEIFGSAKEFADSGLSDPDAAIENVVEEEDEKTKKGK